MIATLFKKAEAKAQGKGNVTADTRIRQGSSGSADNSITKDCVLEKDGGETAMYMAPAYPVFDAFKIVKPQVYVSIGTQHGQLSNTGNDTGRGDQNCPDSSDIETVSEGEPDNRFHALCFVKSGSDSSSLKVDYEAILG